MSARPSEAPESKLLAATAAGLALGMALSPWLAAGPWPLFGLMGLFALRSRPRLLAWALALLLVGPAAWWFEVRSPREAFSDVARLAPRRFVRIEAVVATPPELKHGMWRCEVHVVGVEGHAGVTGRLRASWPAGARPVVGDRWRLAGGLRRPDPPMNPAEFDYPGFLSRRGIFAVFFAEEGRRLRPESGWELPRLLDRLRLRLLLGLGAGLSEPQAALLGSLVLGAGAAPVPEDTERDFRRVGLSHVLAASGAQVALLAGLMYGGLRLLRLSAPWAAALSAPWLVLYMGLTGAPPSMVRATLMGLIALGGLALGRSGVPFAALYAAVAAMLMAEPTVLHDLGFQFSVLATYGLMRLAGFVRGLPGGTLKQVTGALAVPVVALAWVSPWQLAMFNVWSWWALPANWLAGCLILLLTPLGVALASLGLVAPAWVEALNQLTRWPLSALAGLVSWLAALPGNEFSVASPPPAGLAAMYVALWCGLRRPRSALVALALAGAASLGPGPSRELELAFLAVGQGDGLVVRTPGGRWIVIDAGPGGRGSDAGARVVVPYLRRRGCHRVDLMIATHAHQDHVGGLPSVASALPVTAAWEAGQIEESDAQQAVFSSWLARGVPWRAARPGLSWSCDGVKLEVLSASRTRESLNDGSIVVKLTYGAFRVLLTGDLEVSGERALLGRGTDLGAEVLKVGHHGSRGATSPDWLAAVAPRLAIISAGPRNRFGHPHREVLERLRRARCAIARTDRDGAVLVRSDGKRWRHADGATAWRGWRAGR